MAEDPVSARLRGLPHLADSLSRFRSALAAQPARTALFVGGGIAKDTVDRFSDLDLVLVHEPGLAFDGAARMVAELAAAAGPVVTSYGAGHLGRSRLIVHLVSTPPTLTKIDVEVVAAPAADLHGPLILLHDSLGLDAGPAPAGPARDGAVDAELLARKLCGWLWYSYTKLARGELLQTVESIAYTRRHALLPVLLMGEGLPQEDYRRAERRLSPAAVAALSATHPASLDRDALLAALLELAHQGRRVFQAVLPAPQARALRDGLDAVLDAIRHEEIRLPQL